MGVPSWTNVLKNKAEFVTFFDTENGSPGSVVDQFGETVPSLDGSNDSYILNAGLINSLARHAVGGWVNFPILGVVEPMWDQSHNILTQRQFQVFKQANNTIRIRAWDAVAANNDINDSTITVLADTWYHIFMIIQPLDNRVVINGIDVTGSVTRAGSGYEVIGGVIEPLRIARIQNGTFFGEFLQSRFKWLLGTAPTVQDILDDYNADLAIINGDDGGIIPNIISPMMDKIIPVTIL